MNDSNSVPARIVIVGTATMKLSDRFVANAQNRSQKVAQNLA